jgi:hypothetical protein
VCQAVNLWIDSTDFPIEARKGKRYQPKRGRKTEHWSFKLNKPGRRYHFILNGRAKVVWKSAGYSPKRHDGSYVIEHRQKFEENFSGGHIIGDEHYNKPKRLINNPIFYAPHRQSRHLTQAQLSENRRQTDLRARVEMPFGWLKTTFTALEKPWAGELEQLDHLVSYTIGIYNLI